jgi:hypothetical protein
MIHHYFKVTGLDFTGRFINEEIADSFALQRQTSQIILVFTIIRTESVSARGFLSQPEYSVSLCRWRRCSGKAASLPTLIRLIR